MNHFGHILKVSTLLAVASLLTAACSKSSSGAGVAVSDAVTPTAEELEKARSLNIRYIDSDSIMAGYELAKEFQELTFNQLNRLESTGQARQAELQKLAASIEQKMRTNQYETQSAYESDMNSANQKQQEAAAQLARMERQAQVDAAQRQAELADSINSFIRDYNATKGYDAILYKGAGVYFNPALDITDEVLKGLNERYAKSKKK